MPGRLCPYTSNVVLADACPHAGLELGLQVAAGIDQQGGEVVAQAVEVKLVHLAHAVHGAVDDPRADRLAPAVGDERRAWNAKTFSSFLFLVSSISFSSVVYVS